MAFLLPRLSFALCLATTAACSSGTTGGYAGGDDSGTPPPTPTGTGTTTPPPLDHPDASVGPTPDAAVPVDKTLRFDLTLDGQAITIANTSVKIEAGSNGGPDRIVVDGSYQQTTGPFGSTATFTIRAETTAKGLDTCGTDGRSASYWFKDTDGTIRGLGTSLQGGNCTMNVVANAADAFSSGTAKGVIGGAKQKAFTITWGQPLPAK